MTNGTSVTVTTPAPRGLTPEQQEQYCTLFPSACGRPHGTNTATESAGNNGFTLGIRAPGQSFNDCMKANASNYSLLGIADFALDANGKIADNFWLGFTPASNTVSNLYNAVTGSLTSLVQAGQMAVRTGMGTTLTYGRRTSSIMSLILISFQTKIGLEGKVADVGFEGGLYKDVKTKETGMAISAGIFLIGGHEYSRRIIGMQFHDIYNDFQL